MSTKDDDSNPRAEFSTTLLSAGKTATGFEVPPAVVDSFGSGKRPPVRVTINGYTYRSTVAVMGGAYLVGVSAEHRKGADVAGGDLINIVLELDTQAREVDVPADLAAALEANPQAKRGFDALSYSRKQAYVNPIETAKTSETRQRRIDKAIAELSS